MSSASSKIASSRQFQQLLSKSPQLRKGIQDVRYDVFAHLPQLNIRTGHQKNRIQLKGVYYNQYYMDSIATSARKVIPGYMSEEEERKYNKLQLMKSRGKGPPKKGSGSRKGKK